MSTCNLKSLPSATMSTLPGQLPREGRGLPEATQNVSQHGDWFSPGQEASSLQPWRAFHLESWHCLQPGHRGVQSGHISAMSRLLLSPHSTLYQIKKGSGRMSSLCTSSPLLGSRPGGHTVLAGNA